MMTGDVRAKELKAALAGCGVGVGVVGSGGVEGWMGRLEVKEVLYTAIHNKSRDI